MMILVRQNAAGASSGQRLLLRAAAVNRVGSGDEAAYFLAAFF
jgi:hypothetical protein